MASRILVIDDDASTLLLIRAALVKAGYEVITATDGARGIATFREQPCDMVMLDVEMPGMSGFDVCEHLRADAGDELPIVMVTGMDDIASIERAYEAGATDFIAKPIHWALIGHQGPSRTAHPEWRAGSPRCGHSRCAGRGMPVFRAAGSEPDGRSAPSGSVSR